MDPDPLNLETLESLREYDDSDEPGFLADLIGSYLADTESRFASARDAHGAGDAASLARFFHAIKGSSLNLGAENLATLMQRLERECKQGALPPAERLQEGEAEFRRVKAALSAWLG